MSQTSHVSNLKSVVSCLKSQVSNVSCHKSQTSHVAMADIFDIVAVKDVAEIADMAELKQSILITIEVTNIYRF